LQSDHKIIIDVQFLLWMELQMNRKVIHFFG